MDVSEWDWVVNTNDMTCRNEENEVIIKMEKVGDFVRGRLHNMPMKLFAEISRYEDGEKIIERIVKIAEEKYLENRQGHLIV